MSSQARSTHRFRLQEIGERGILPAIVLSILLVYLQVLAFQFMAADDDLYIRDNPHVLAGPTPSTIRWAFTAVVASNWLPVTLLSHSLDVLLFGLNSGLHHMTNVALHGASAVLLFLLLRRATRDKWPSAFVAFMFALHPLHVESVAWISERKDVLSTFFWFLALYCYVSYGQRPSLARYLAVMVAFAAGLMAKPMLVTLPFTLLLFDFWPLRRWQWPRVLWEKLPFLVLAAATSAVTYWAQQTTGAMVIALGPGRRVVSALVSYGTYFIETLWPIRLAVFYPMPKAVPLWQAAGAAVLLFGMSAAVIKVRRTRPYLATGWFWYLGTLVPVIGLVQVGQQAHADRYMYVPMVGLSLMLGWAASDFCETHPESTSWAAGAGVVACLAWMALAWRQTGFWRDCEQLNQHAIAVTENNYFAEDNLGAYLDKFPERRSEAAGHFEAALEYNPYDADAHNDFGVEQMRAGFCNAAIPHFEAALRISPRMSSANNNLGMCLSAMGDYASATRHFEAAVRLNPNYAQAHFNLGKNLARMPGHDEQAIAECRLGLRLFNAPDYKVHSEMGMLFEEMGRKKEALAELEAAFRIQPDQAVGDQIEKLRASRDHDSGPRH